ncbi:MAG: small basic protein [Candidatus Omnitrophica bacterium]|nr:small basic protein [Candidatus Omnitrophota bacterium]MDD5573866.1 small basic protein [Candidatus Omnitrophota bacterium]
MSIHPSLGAAAKRKQAKSVLKRSERIKYLMSKGLWKEDSKVFGLPKIKAVRIKIKKEKAADKPAEEGAVAAGTPPTAAPDAKAKTSAKK